ncbi:MAG: OmpA family protein [Bacteroidota bacterium]
MQHLFPGLPSGEGGSGDIFFVKNFIKHITQYFLLSGLMIALSSQTYAQTSGGTRIDNVSSAIVHYLNGSQDTVKSNMASIVVEKWGALLLNKTVSRDSVHARDTVLFKIVVGYNGNLSAAQVVITDTVPTHFRIISSSKGTVNGNIVTWNAGTISAPTPDSVIITTVVTSPFGGQFNTTNTAYAIDSVGIRTTSSAIVHLDILQTESCKLKIEKSTDKIIGNGQQWAVIRANITDSIGVPKPDGTPVFFKADLGVFSNGKDSVTKFSLNGFVADSLNANLSSGSIVKAKVTVQLLSVCDLSDTINVEFYPGAITGVVLDHSTKTFYKNAYVRLIDSVQNVLIDIDTTKADGKFFMFVPKTGVYRVDVSAADKFALNNTVTTFVNVDIKGDVARIVPNKNSISGTVYYWINNTPIYIPNMPIELFDITNGDNRSNKDAEAKSIATVLKTTTDSRGVYEFEDIKPGKYRVLLGASELNGASSIIIPEQGYYILNGNIPVELTVTPTFEKSGTPTVVLGDTIEYQMRVRNINAFAVTNSVVTDTLLNDVEYISSTNNGTYNSAVHSVRWSIGNVDSSYKNVLSVKVRVKNSTPASLLVNRATLSASEIFPIIDTAATVIMRNPLLAIVKTANKDSAAIGDTMQYRIVVKNIGDTPLTNVSMVDTVDAQKFIVLLVSSNATLQNNIVSMARDTLAVGDSAVVTIRVRVRESALFGFVNRAFAQSQLTPVQSSTVVTLWKQTIGPNVANFILSKFVSKDTAVNGDTVKYTIRIKNNGSKILTNVVVIDTLPKQLTKNTVLYNNGTIDNNIVTYFAGTLAVDATDSVVVVSVVAGSPYIPERVTNTAYAKSNEVPFQTAQAKFVSLIGKLDRLLLNISVSSPTVFTGDSLSYVLRITNVSNRKLTNVIVRDPVPFQLENIRVENPNSTARSAAKITIVPMRKSGIAESDTLRLDGSVAIYKKDTIDVGEVDSFYVKTTVRLDRPNFELILNTGYATTNETEQIIAQAVTLVEPRTNKNFQLQLEKRVSKDTVHIGDTMSYVIHFKNITGGPLTKISIVDTLPVQIINPRVSGSAKVENNIVTYEVGFLGPNKEDSIIVIGQLDPYGVHDGELVLNYAFARAFQIEEQTAFAIFTAKTDPACRIEVIATPEKIIGNGKSKAFIQVNLTNTLGYPKPDGTPVVMTTTVGQFTNGQSMRVLYSKDGKASDSLRATIAGNNLIKAMAIASADDGQGCKAKDTVEIVFFPGAIEGTVIDHRTQSPVKGAIVRAYSKTTDSLAGEVITKEDGYYLIAVTKTDSFRVLITTVNEFGRQITVETEVKVSVSGGGDLPTPNQNSVSGAVYYLVSHEPIPAANLSIYLQSVTPSPKSNVDISISNNVATIDSVLTDSAGTYKFDRIPAGRFIVLLNHPTIKNSVELTNSGNGQYVINANISVVLNPNIVFDKSGPSRVALSDTATYKINVGNTGNLSTTNTIVIDSLHWAMKFISATGGGVYQPASHRIVWNIGKLDSLVNREYDVTVRFVDTLKNSTPSLNRASVTTNQTTLMRDSVPTLLFLPPTMKMWKVSNVHQANPGDTVVYSIKMQNRSGSFGDSIAVTDKLPTQVQYLKSNVQYFRSAPQSVMNDTVEYNSASHSIFWKRDTMFVGDSVTINLITRVRTNLEPGDHTYTNVAGVTWKGGSLTSDQDSLSNTMVRSSVSYLKVTKQALRKVLEIGDIATYLVRVTNMSAVNYARDIQLVDKIPFGFRYMNGSSVIDTMKVSDPTGRKELFWLLKDSLAPSASVQIVYRLVVGAGAVEGNGINTARAYGISHFGAQMASAEVQEQVEIRRGVFTTHGLIIGKVFYDDNRNKYQDSLEYGVKGIELMMEDGTRIITGDDGKYSIPDVLPGEHVIRVRTHTLPKNSSLEMGYNDFAKDSTSRFVNLTESGIARVDFYLARNISRPDSLVLSQAIAKIGDFSIQRISSPRNIVFIEDKRLASMKLTGLNFEVGKAILKPEAFVTLKQLADVLREYPDQPLIIAGHTDSMKIATAEFPNNGVLSMARAMSVKSYLVEKEGINVDRIRIEGHGETRPVATNKSIDGRSLNRRVEFYFTPTTEEKQITEMPVSIEIPIEYTGTENITKVDFRDILNPSFKYVEGSAMFADSTVTPRINGNELHWTLTNLGPNFKYKLRYTVMVQRPERYEATEIQSTSTSICYFVGDSALHCIDSLITTNEVAIAVRGRAVNFVMSGVLFDVGKATLRSTALTSLETTAKFLKEDLSSTALIEGHTDSSPIKTKEFPSNIELSQARANTIKQKLIAHYGIAPERLKTIGYGEFRPLASNYTIEGKQVNRRIELRILRSEFAQKVLLEGGVDSSKLVVETLLPKNAPQGIDSMMRDKSKERYILKLDVRRKVKRNTVSTIILDTVPAGLQLVPYSVTSVHGVDSVNVSGKVLKIYCSKTDSTIQLYYIAEVSDDGKEEATIFHDYTVIKKQTDGSIIEEKAKASSIEIRKKQMLVRNQR